MNAIVTRRHHEPVHAEAGFVLAFAEALRPTANAIALASDQSAGRFAVTHRPDPADGTMEVLAQGMALDLAGLDGGPSLPLPSFAHRIGFAAADEARAPGDAGLAALVIRPGPHLAGAARLLPVVRALAGVAAALATLPGLHGIGWLPAGTFVAPAVFARMIAAWVEGGPFPALGLAALVAEPDGALRSEGLAFFTGQELWLEPAPGRDRRDLARIAVRLIDELVTAEPITGTTRFPGPDGEPMIAEPDGEYVVVRMALDS